MARKTIKLWQLILFGPLLIFIGIWEYRDLGNLEEHGGTIYVNKLTALFYHLGGKSTVLLVWLALGGAYVWMLVRFLRFERESNRKLAALEARPDKPTRPKTETPPRPSPPTIDRDPFRAPPAQALVIENPLGAPSPTPIVAGDPSDRPRLLT